MTNHIFWKNDKKKYDQVVSSAEIAQSGKG